MIEVYRGHQKAERHMGVYALYVMFFPQLVAGPIERPQNLLHQFYEPHTFDYQRVTDALKLMAWGLFKKVVIADRLAIVVNQVYGHPRDYVGLPLMVSTVFFAFQIYCDFSGYSDMAIGAAQVMGFRLMNNFNHPYFSKSIGEFWKRWHISLSTWFRDYLYIPLGGNRTTTWRWQMNLFITFVVSGLWHGANWTYIIWGAVNGCYLIGSLWTQSLREGVSRVLRLEQVSTIHTCLRIAMTFSLVCIAWVFFRASTIQDALYILTHMFQGLHQGWKLVGVKELCDMSGGAYELVVSMVFIALMEGVHVLQRTGGVRRALATKPMWVRWGLYYALISTILIFGVRQTQQFIYFQF